MSPYTLARTVRGSGPGLLLAHGGGGGVEANFGPILDGLARTRKVVGADYPGTGATPRSDRPLTLDDLADALVEAADAEGLTTFDLVGYSLGGPVAARIATRHPDRVTSLALTATFATPNAWLREISTVIGDGLRGSHDRATLARLMVLLCLNPAVADALPPADLDALVAMTAGSIPPGTADHFGLVRDVDVRSDLAALRVPTLVIVTTEDRLAEPAVQYGLAAQISGVQVAELPTGHLPFAERPQEWEKLISDFIAGTR